MARIAGHEIAFLNCSEIGQGGPEACEMWIDGRRVPREYFDPSPLAYRDGILIPVRRISFFASGYALAFVDPARLKLRVVSKIQGYMRLIEVTGDEVTFVTRAYDDDERDSLPVRID
jgi:hypothetical protein